MKNWGFSLCATLVISVAAQAEPKVDHRYFEITSMEVKQVASPKLSLRTFTGSAIGSSLCGDNGGSPFQVKKVKPTLVKPNKDSTETEAPESTPQDVPPQDPSSGTSISDVTDLINAISGTDMIFDQVVNLGKKVWNLIDSGKPVVNLKTDVATALPAGAKCWLDLQLWQEPQSVSYLVSLKNGYGMEVVRFVYRIITLTGGSVDGRGAYIGYATIQPAEVKVAWGFRFNATVTAPTVYNLGTRENPVGGMTLNLNYQIQPILGIAHIEVTEAFRLNGRGELVKMN
ncbi:MAG: hypothetical protein ACAH59_06550 [Pseudobdellovibrionaceae bacterium]